MNSYWAIGSFAFGLTLILVLLIKAFFPRLGLMDRPKKYGLKRDPIPYPAGIALYLSFLISTLVFLDWNMKLIGLLVAAGALVSVSFVDDRKGLSPWWRLLVQVLVALMIIFSGIGIEGITNPLGGYIDLTQINWSFSIGGVEQSFMALSALFTVVWIVLLVNTMNWLDGIPGMASGIGAIGGAILFLLSVSDLVNQPHVATMALILGVSAAVMWWFDFYPPQVILGDSGSMFLGLILAIISIFSDGKIATAFLILGFAILDAVYVVVHRLLKKQAPWKGGEWDKYRKAVHLHHRMLKSGFTERQVLMIIYTLSAIFGITALFIGTQGKFWAIVVLGLVSFVLGLVLHFRMKKRG